jgi:hypothetical protein
LKYLNLGIPCGTRVTYPIRPKPTQNCPWRQFGSSTPFVVVQSHLNGSLEERNQSTRTAISSTSENTEVIANIDRRSPRRFLPLIGTL